MDDFIELLEPATKRKVHMLIKDLEQQLLQCNEASKEWDRSGEEAEKIIQDHFAICLKALAERKATLLKQVAYKVAAQKKKVEDLRVVVKESMAECHKTLDMESFYDTEKIKPLHLAFPVAKISPELSNALLQTISNHGAVIMREKRAENATALEVVTIAGGKQGFVDGKAAKAKFDQLRGICWNPRDDSLFVCDSGNNSIRKMSAQGDVSTFANASKGFNKPHGIVPYYRENALFVVNQGSHTISKVSSAGEVTLFAGKGKEDYKDGIGSKAAFRSPNDIAIDQQTGTLFVSDSRNHAIRRITSKGEVTTVAGSPDWGFADGPGKFAKFANPWGVYFDDFTHSLLVCDSHNNKIRRISASGEVTTMCEIQKPAFIVMTLNRTILVTSQFFNKIYKVVEQGDGKYEVVVMAGTGQGAIQDGKLEESSFNCPNGIAYNASSNCVFVVDYLGSTIRKISL